MVKAFDSKSNGIFPRRFESYSQRCFLILMAIIDQEKCALSGNRTPVSRVAGENSTTEPTMLSIERCSNVRDEVYKAYLVGHKNAHALSGNRTPVSRVAGENSTTEPTMLESCECPHSEISPLPEKGQRYTKLTTMGIEPTIFRFEVGRLIHWATRPMPM